MKKSKFLMNLWLCSGVLFAMSACSETLDEGKPLDPVDNIVPESTMGIAKAKQKLVEILNNPVIRVAHELRNGYSISSITNGRALDAEGNLLTRADDKEALYYAFDIDENGGYAIIGNSNELPELIALSAGSSEISEGSLADIAIHGATISNLPNDLRVGVSDSAIISPGTEADNLKITVRDSVKYAFVGPARPLNTQWGCEYPFNAMLPQNQYGLHANAGCVCIATAQLLAYKDYQPTYMQGTADEVKFNWDLISRYTSKFLEDTIGEMRNVGKNNIAPLCSLINSKENLQPQFFWDRATLANYYNVFRTFDHFGISYGNGLTSYSIERVISGMSDGKPLMISGGGSSGGHAWIIDAVIAETSFYTVIDGKFGGVIEHNQVTRYLVHCNWGWDGMCNGYFYSGIFDSGNRPIISGIGQEGNFPDEPGYGDCSNRVDLILNVVKSH